MSSGEEESVTPTVYYYDSDYYEDDNCDNKDLVRFGAVVTSLFFWLVFVLSILGNVLVLVILAKYENLRSLTNSFILNLAVSDLVFTAGLPFWADYHISGWRWGDAACKAVSFVFYLGFYSSGIFLIVMTVHRCLAVTRPLSDILFAKVSFSLQISTAVWTVSVLAATPYLIFSKVLTSDDEHPTTQYCEYEDKYWKLWGFYQQNALFVVTVLVFCFCYGQILARLLKPAPNRRPTRHRTVKLIFSLVMLFFVMWAPYNIVIFLKSLTYVTQPDSMTPTEACAASKRLDYGFYICRFIAFSHCCLNPVFYVFVGLKFKNHLKRFLQSFSQEGRSSSFRHQRHTIISITSGEELSM